MVMSMRKDCTSPVEKSVTGTIDRMGKLAATTAMQPNTVNRRCRTAQVSSGV
jgi:hypothetical protein